MNAHGSRAAQGGGFLIGLVVGVLIGLAVALGVALYVTKAPNPFVNKVPTRTPSQDAAETERNRNWDPNSALAGRNPAPGASGVVSGGEPVAPAVGGRPALIAPTVIDAVPPATAAPPARGGAGKRAPGARAAAARASQAQTAGAATGRRARSPISCKPALTLAAKTPSSSAPNWRCSASKAA